MKYKNIIFDLDGTLLDTLEDLNASINLMLNDLSLPLRSLKQTHDDIGDGIKMLVKRSLPQSSIEQHYDRAYKLFTNYYQIHCLDKTKPYDGVYDTLTQLKSLGYKLAVVTNKYNIRAIPIVEHFFPNTFDYIQGQQEPFRRKPYPDMVENVIKQLQIDKKETVYIGDTETDYQTAKNSKLDCILLCSGYRDKEQLLQIEKNLPLAENILDIFKYL